MPEAAALSGQRLIDEQATGVGDGEQVAGEVATVDRRDVLGLQPLQRLRVVPVVEMTVESFEPIDRRQREPPSRSTMSTVPIHPKSRALTVANRYMPMLVGDVRWAINGCGSSW